MRAIASVVLALFVGACGQPQAPSAGFESATRSEPTTSPARTTITLPDFSGLVEREGAAVVNISTVQTVRRDQAFPRLPGIPEDDPFYDFFRRFMPPGPREYQTRSLGSGFLISEDGFLLTNAHVVRDASEVTVKLTDRREFTARVVGVDLRSDVALLKIDASGLPFVRIGDPEQTRVGEWVLAIGSPFGFENSVTAGIISAKGRALPDESYVPFLQTDVPINPGNSGGPLFNLDGEVIGINAQIYSRTGGYMGLSFAIPIDVAMNVAGQLRATGRVVRGRLGVQIQEITPDLARSFSLERPVGALVAGVERGSPAASAGLRPGDVILRFNGKAIDNANDLPPLVVATRPGMHVELEIWRDRSARRLTVTIGQLDDQPQRRR
jgi:serine protease Do